jgi:transposase InsO family protein
VDQICGGCLAGKHHRSLFPHRAEYRAEEVLELVHGDLCGPITPPAPSGSRYFLLLIDDNNRYMWLRTLRSKDQAAVAIKQFQQVAEAETGRKLRVFQSDRGGEFTSVEFAEYCVEQGLHHQLMAPYSPQQNGVVERRNQMVVGTACCLLKSKGLPGWFWGGGYGDGRVPPQPVADEKPRRMNVIRGPVREEAGRAALADVRVSCPCEGRDAELEETRRQKQADDLHRL